MNPVFDIAAFRFDDPFGPSADPARYVPREQTERALAARILSLPQVEGVVVLGEALRVTVSDTTGFSRAFTAIAAEWPGGVTEIEPLDEDLAFVFGHLVS